MEQYLKEKGILPSSAKVYTFHYNKLKRDVFENVEPENMMLEENLNKVIKYVDESKFTSNSKGCYLRAWKKIASLKKHEGDVNKLTKEINKYNYECIYVPATQKELENKVDIDYVIKMRNLYKNKLTDKFHTNDLYYLLCSLYSYLPPLRSEDYYNAIIKKDTTDLNKENYYDINTKQFIINQYKTKNTHGQRIIDIPNELCEIINSFHDKSNSDYLICTRTGKKLDSGTFLKTMQRCLRKNVSSSMLRKSYISSKIDSGISACDRKSDAKIMAHTVSTQQLMYSKLSDVLHPQNDNMEYLKRRSKQLSNELNEIHKRMLEIM
jgi:hypothetical protein